MKNNNKNKKKNYHIKHNAGNVPANNAFFNIGTGMMEDMQEPVNVKEIIKEIATPELVEFINQHAVEINGNRFNLIYQELPAHLVSKFTELMLFSGIKPLTYMRTVPALYLANSEHVPYVIIGDNIQVIGANAFMSSEIKTIDIGLGVKKIFFRAFAHMRGEPSIRYAGTY